MPRPELFEMAVGKALAYAERLGALDEEPDQHSLRQALELWYLKTRFAYRIPLDEIVVALQTYPGEGYYWVGGEAGKWHKGEDISQ